VRVAILGYGAVAAVHVRGLAEPPVAIFGPNEEKARRFAAQHGIPLATASMEEAVAGADAAIVCSPTPRHAEQARATLEAGVNVLVELPACGSLDEALALGNLAETRGRVLQCAHTSRYLEPFRRLGEWIRAGELGEIWQIRYWRTIPPRSRSWTDDALLHHAEHPLDLMLHWFGELRPLACAAHPAGLGAQNAALVGEVAGGAPVSISISYTASIPGVGMTVAGSKHTVETDGFSFMRSDRADWCWQGDEDGAYQQAIAAQDAAFLSASEGSGGGVDWSETVTLTAAVEQFRELWEKSRRSA
jgi:2-hydroxy-4-carboxymuconate semialdehyde hemiacetal dehydrogenase